MAGTGDPTIDALLAEARAGFTASLPAKVDALQELVARRAWEDVRRAAHKLRGSASTYGHAAVSAVASAIEEALIAAADEPDAAARERIAAHLVEAHAAVAQASKESR